MIVTAALIWFNERPEDLAACVRGMASIADRLVAVDGAYARYPDASDVSDWDQHDAIWSTGKELGLAVEVITPIRLWAGQVEKRSVALSKAAEGSDWVAVFDADWIATGDREKARAELEATDADVISVPFYTPPSENPVASSWHTAIGDTTDWIPHLFRALPEIAVEKYHWHISARKNGEKVYLWGPANEGRVLPQHRLVAPYQVEHRTLQRTEEQIRASRAFLNDRMMVEQLTGQEDDMPHLPRPVFDFDTVPDLRAQRHARRHMSPRRRQMLRRQGR